MTNKHSQYVHGFLTHVTASNLSDLIDKRLTSVDTKDLYVHTGILYSVSEAREEITKALEMAYTQGYKQAMQEVHEEALARAHDESSLFEDKENEKT